MQYFFFINRTLDAKLLIYSAPALSGEFAGGVRRVTVGRIDTLFTF